MKTILALAFVVIVITVMALGVEQAAAGTEGGTQPL